jgi:hypothetical protein
LPERSSYRVVRFNHRGGSLGRCDGHRLLHGPSSRLGGGLVRFGKLDEVFDLFSEPRGYDLHALRQLARQQFGLAAGSFAYGRRVVSMDVQRQGAERHNRQDKERQDEAQAQVHN